MVTSANLGSSFDVEQVELAPQATAVVRGTVRPADILAFLGHAFSVDRSLPQQAGVESDELPGGHALRIPHVGAYEDVGPAYQVGESWLATHHKVHRGDPWESYVNDPEVEHPRTVVHMPFRDIPGDGQHDS